MPTVDELQESRAGRRWLKKEVARRSRCPYCGTSGKMIPDFRKHVERHVLLKEKPLPEFN